MVEMTHRPLSLLEIAQGMVACRSNARELLEESTILSASGRFARAYALAHTACEELAKFSILELAGKRLAQGDQLRWKRFWQRFRSHDSKVAQLNVQLLYLMSETPDIVDAGAADSVEKLFDYGLSVRNAALYVDVGPSGLRKPSDLDFSVPFPALHITAKLALDASGQRGNSAGDIELGLQKPPNQSDKAKSLAVLSQIIERLRDSGVDKDAFLTMLVKMSAKQ